MRLCPSSRLLRWGRSLHAQLLLWAILPLILVVIAVAFTGVYAHQRQMRDFVARYSMVTAHLIARSAEDALAYGMVGMDGQGLALWLPMAIGESGGTVIVVAKDGRVLAHSDPTRVGEDMAGHPGVMAALRQRDGYTVLTDPENGPVLIAFAPVGGSDWEVLVQEPVEGFVAPILYLPALAPVAAVGAGFLSLLMLVFGWRTIIRPLQRLSHAAGQVSWGNFSAIREPVGGVQEIRDLHQALAGMAERIQGYQVGMRDYLAAVTRGQEEERYRLARELHDGLIQELIASGQRMEMARRAVEGNSGERARVLLNEMQQMHREMMEELRRIIRALRPVYLEDLGLLPALEVLVQQAAAHATVSIRLEQQGSPRRFTPEVELAVYRVAQEALNNVLQHAQARNILLKVRFAPDGLTLTVSDDGVGFEFPPRSDLLTQAGHYGLVGMHERVVHAGGEFRIHTSPGEGTQITAHFPASPRKA